MVETRSTEGRLLANFVAELTEIDQTAQVILKGSVLIEAQVEGICSSLSLGQANVSFRQKADLLRAAISRGDGDEAWPLVLAFNRLRNSLAHGEANAERSDQIEQLRKMLLTRVSDEAKQRLREGSELEVATLAGAMASDFLTSIEKQVWHIEEPSVL